jgi:predicted AlkP superfamily pyrophosphatase or phosphodiesterase
MKLLPARVLALALVFAFSCAASAGEAAAVPRPKLVVLLVVDGLPQRQVLDYRDQLAPDGLARFLDRGAWFSQAHYSHAFTVTAAGHATLLTGATPSRTGIIGNDWRDPQTGAPQYCVADLSATYIGHKTQALDGTSPKNLRVESLGDVLRRLDARSKVIAVSGKDRGAILLAGKGGTAYVYMGASGEFASSTYYMAQHPQWVMDFNASKPADRYFSAQWKALLPEAAYARSLPDEQKWFPLGGGKLPMTLGGGEEAPGPRFYSSLLRSPFVDALTLEFARAAVAGEALGQDDAPDILAVSLSGHDYVNHSFSAESRLSHDHLLQLDRLLQAFFRDLDARLGPDNYLAVLTADHGFMPAPEYSAKLGRDASRLSPALLLGLVNQGLERRFGEGKWAPYFSASGLLLNHALIAQRQLDPQLVADEARRLLLGAPGIAVAYTRSELESGSRAGAPYFEQMRKSFSPQVPVDLQFALKPYWMFGSGSSGSTHGSPYATDTQVPILFFGPRWVQPGRIDARVEVVDIAPTLARLLGVAAPAASEGRLLPLSAPSSAYFQSN